MTKLAAWFPAATRKQGEKLCRYGTPEIEYSVDAMGEHGCVLIVNDRHESHMVCLKWSDKNKPDAMHVACDCERYASGYRCPHIWAALVHVEEEGGTKLNGQTLDEWDFDDLHDVIVRLADMPTRLSGVPVKPSAVGSIAEQIRRAIEVGRSPFDLPGPVEKTPTWQDTLASIRNAARNSGSLLGGIAPIYVLDISQSRGTGELAIHVYDPTPDASGQHRRLRFNDYDYPSALRRSDAAIVRRLLDMHQYASEYY
ncbi:MAG: hypothetical protein KDA58_07075, partial [Planctomycetaceae bacterium]|nr:hypothetical protein [Planctomycetaceae bacterium]